MNTDTCKESEAAANDIVAGGLLEEDPASEHDLDLISKWLLDCRENHPLCARPMITFNNGEDQAEGFTPTRLLHFSNFFRRIR